MTGRKKLLQKRNPAAQSKVLPPWIADDKSDDLDGMKHGDDGHVRQAATVVISFWESSNIDSRSQMQGLQYPVEVYILTIMNQHSSLNKNKMITLIFYG